MNTTNSNNQSSGLTDLLQLYKQILSSILPSHMLTEDGFLKTQDGLSESIDIQTSGDGAFYAGALALKAIRHQVEKAKPLLPQDNYDIIKKFIDQYLLLEGNEDIINIGGARHRGVLAHETFHDIQGHLYDYYPDIIDKLFQSINKSKKAITEWYQDPNNSEYSAGPDAYQLEHFFPPTEPGTGTGMEPIGKRLGVAAYLALREAKVEPSMDSIVALGTGVWDIGRNETIPVLLGAASEGNTAAAQILETIFSDAGLRSDFYKDLPRFNSGGSVPALISGTVQDKQKFEQTQHSLQRGLGPSDPSLKVLPEFYEQAFAKIDANNGKFTVIFNWASFGFGVLWYFNKGMWVKGVGMLALVFLLGGLPAAFFWIYSGIAGTYDYYLLRVRGTQLW